MEIKILEQSSVIRNGSLVRFEGSSIVKNKVLYAYAYEHNNNRVLLTGVGNTQSIVMSKVDKEPNANEMIYLFDANTVDVYEVTNIELFKRYQAQL